MSAFFLSSAVRPERLFDGGAPITVECYNPSTVFQAGIYATGILPDGEHTLLIEWAGSKHPSASNYYISLDAFDVMGTLSGSR